MTLLDDPSHPETHSPQEALAHLREAWQLAPDRARYALHYVRALLQRGRRDEARQAIAIALERLPEGEREVSAQLRAWLEESLKSPEPKRPAVQRDTRRGG